MRIELKTTLIFLACGNAIAADIQSKEQQQATQAAVSAMQGDVSALKSQASSLVDQGVTTWLRDKLSTDKGVTEVSATGISGSSPVWSVLLVRPLSEDNNENTFVQGSVLHQNSRTTVNLGYGYRKLVSDDRVLLGTNIFYDHEFPYDHQRMSLGGEVRTTVGELNANIYQGVSGWRRAASGFEEKALGGYDAEVAIAIPYIPSTQIRVKNFRWNGIDSAADLKGNTYSLTGEITNGFSIEAGYTNNNNIENDRFVKIAYTLSDAQQKGSKKARILSTPYSLDSMADKRFDKVRRENRIVKATRNTGFAVTAIGY